MAALQGDSQKFMTRIFAVLLVLGFIVGNLYKFSFFSQYVHISLLDITIFVLILLSLLINRLSFKAALQKYRPLTLSIYIFLFTATISLLISFFHFGLPITVIAALYLFRWLLYSLFFASVVQLNKQPVVNYLPYYLGIVTAIVGLGQYLFFPDIRALQVLEWDPHYFRVVGTFLDPGFTGLILVFTLILLTLHPLKNRLVNLISWTASYLAFALTYSRSSYLAFLAAMAYIAWRRKSLKFVLFIVILFFTTLYALPRSPGGEGVNLERTSSIQARIANWKNSLTIIKDHPLLGVGFNTYRYTQREYGFLDDSNWLKSHAGAGADSSLLFVAATTGVVGLAAYLWYLRSLYQLSTINYSLKATLVAVLVHSLFLNSLFYPAIMVWLSLLIPCVSDFRTYPLPRTLKHSRLHSK